MMDDDTVELAHRSPCDLWEPHEDHVKPGPFEDWCPGVAPEFPSEKIHTAQCANRRITDKVMLLRPGCTCATRWPANTEG